MKATTKIFIVITLCFSFAGIVKADVGPMSRQTAFYFQQNGQPITQQVEFTVKCYGTSAMGSESKLLKISEASETCQSYGCKFNTTNLFEVYRQNTKYCDLEGGVNGQKFSVNKFVGNNLSGLNCHRADFNISTGDKYYKKTPAYKSCYNAVLKEYYPSWNGDENGNLGNFICHQSLVEVPQNECAGYGYITINNICYKFTNETYACIAEKDRKMKLCDQYLEDVTSKLAKDSNGYPFEQICEVNVPVSISSTNNQEAPNIQPTTQNQTPTEQPQTPTEQPSKNIFIRIIDFFRCSFLKIFGKSC
ncbi:hypothetical protein KKG58_05345 [Patescibacteria group bacterium]|nr:hypothetical protein [Patescibacteria group bacterium]